jgi:hypothetical protein
MAGTGHAGCVTELSYRKAGALRSPFSSQVLAEFFSAGLGFASIPSLPPGTRDWAKAVVSGDQIDLWLREKSAAAGGIRSGQ